MTAKIKLSEAFKTELKEKRVELQAVATFTVDMQIGALKVARALGVTDDDVWLALIQTAAEALGLDVENNQEHLILAVTLAEAIRQVAKS